MGHLGVATVLGSTRSRFWIIRGYSTIRRILNLCVVCKKVQGQVSNQRMADLPLVRVKEGEPVFTYTGTDCFGPFYTTFGRGRKQQKRYGVIFTCMTVRAVHIEMVPDLSSEAILGALRRFLARRGQIRYLCSDNGTNYRGARSELLKSLGADTVRDRAGDLGIVWEFNPPKASHFGGVWERIIRTVRRVLETVMTNKTYTDDSLQTIFCEVEAAVNGRPLTLVGDTCGGEVLTPQKLLNLGSSVEYYGNVPVEVPDNVKRWKHIQAVSQQFWRRWCRNYRSLLQGRNKWTQKRRNVAVNDVVLLVDESLPRGRWPLGRVSAVRQSGDGLVRTVVVKARGHEYERPITKLVVILENEELP